MNDLSTKLFDHVSGLLNFYDNQNQAGNTSISNQMHTKLFFAYENTGQEEEKKKKKPKKKKKKSSSTATSKNGDEEKK